MLFALVVVDVNGGVSTAERKQSVLRIIASYFLRMPSTNCRSVGGAELK